MIGIEVPIVRKILIVTKATIVTEVPIVTNKMTNVLEVLVDLTILMLIIAEIQIKHALSHHAFFAKSIMISATAPIQTQDNVLYFYGPKKDATDASENTAHPNVLLK